MQAQFDAEKAFLDDRGGPRWIEAYIKPFYRAWMGTGAAHRHDAWPLIPRIRDRAAELSTDDISQMVQMQWRVQVMGTWYAIARADDVFTTPVHRAFDFCYGTLTAPCLTAAVLTYPDPTTTQVLRTYRDRDIQRQYGAAGIINAALRRLALQALPPARTGDDDALDRLLEAARRLQTPG